MRFSAIILASLIGIAAAEYGNVTEHAGLKASKHCSKVLIPDSYIESGQYALVPKQYFDNPPIPGFVCGQAVIVVNQKFPQLRFADIIIADTCDDCTGSDIKLGPGAFKKVSAGTKEFPAVWGQFH